ncbi:hypothetical protein GCM10027265_18230 [Jatrophihabitans fulvus]
MCAGRRRRLGVRVGVRVGHGLPLLRPGGTRASGRACRAGFSDGPSVSNLASVPGPSMAGRTAGAGDGPSVPPRRGGPVGPRRSVNLGRVSCHPTTEVAVPARTE